jgi:hypothetical protein
MMLMTVLQANIEPENWAALKDAYKAGTRHLPEQMTESFLVQSNEDPTLWRGIAIWRSRAEFEEYQHTVDTPGGIWMFRAAGAEPTLTIFDVVGNGKIPLIP